MIYISTPFVPYEAQCFLFVGKYNSLKAMIMKKFLICSSLLLMGWLTASAISPYLRVADVSGSMEAVVNEVNAVLVEGGYEVLGQYQPGNNPSLFVTVFSNKALQEFALKSADRGMLAAAMKVGFQQKDGKISVSLMNPEYLFYAYFGELMNDKDFSNKALQISSEVKSSLMKVGTDMEPFGGEQKAEDLIKYRYMAGMPKFGKAVEVAEFANFDQGVAAIRKGITASGSTAKVYEILNESAEIALFGVGLMDEEKGEAHFLPIIGESHVAAMPYEIILQDNKVSLLHGRYRFALHWPELTMKTFTKIMSSPGDVEDAMKGLFETD